MFEKLLFICLSGLDDDVDDDTEEGHGWVVGVLIGLAGLIVYERVCGRTRV